MPASLISTIVRWASQRRTTALVGIAILLLVSVDGVRRLSFDADILSLLPQHGRVIPAFQAFLARFGTLDQLYVVSTAPEDHDIDEYRAEIDAWAEQLRQAPEIVGVETGLISRSRDFGWLAGRQLLLLDESGLEEALRRLEPDGLAQQVVRARELLTFPSADISELVRQDPAGLLTLLRPTAGGAGTGPAAAPGLDGYVTADGRSRIIVARPRRPPFDADFSRALDQRLRTIEATLGTPVIRPEDAEDEEEARPPMLVEFAGGHRIAVETEALVRREGIMNTVGSLAAILPLLFLVFRSTWLVAVGALPTSLALVVVLSGFGFLGTRLSAAGTGAAAMLFGLGIDGVVLLYVAHMLPNTHPETGSRLSGPASSMLLGMWTTAATFYGLVFVDFPSLQQLGLLVGHSMMICGVLTLLLVPALLPPRPTGGHARALTMPTLPTWIAARRRAILAAAIALTCLLGISATQLRVNPSLERLRSVTDAALLEARIASAFGLPTDLYVVLAEGTNLEALLETNEQLTRRISTELPGVSVQAPTWLLPSAATQARVTQQIARSGLSAEIVRTSLARAAAESGFRPGAFEPFAARLPALLDTAQRLRYDDYARHGLGDLIARFVVPGDGRWHLATYLAPSVDDEMSQVQAIVDQVNPAQTLTGLALVNRELARTFLPEFLKGLGIGAVLVILLVLAAFRDWRLSLFALVPTVVGLIWTGGILALTGVELDLFAVFAVVTLLGIGVDYGIHLVYRYQERRDAARATAELAPVVLVAAAITILGYGTLVTSSYPPLRSIGLVSVVSVVALAVASVLVLPALLLTRGITTDRS